VALVVNSKVPEPKPELPEIPSPTLNRVFVPETCTSIAVMPVNLRISPPAPTHKVINRISPIATGIVHSISNGITAEIEQIITASSCEDICPCTAIRGYVTCTATQDVVTSVASDAVVEFVTCTVNGVLCKTRFSRVSVPTKV
jgi:hypothetical protein